VKLIPLAASYISASAVTNTLFNNNAWNFFTYDWGGTGRGPSGGLGQGYSSFTLAELVKTYSGMQDRSKMIRPTHDSLAQEMMDNFTKNWFNGTLQLVAGAALPKVMNKIPGRPVQKVNRMLKQIGIGDVVKL
tara:strand:+ start:235 stop:633 length:399 start_codon:yes stop_codon:yes gene_type:complete